MKFPYSRLHVIGDVLVAARSGQLHTFNLADGSHISTWKHPDVKSISADLNTTAEADTKGDELSIEAISTQQPTSSDPAEPPAKRQKTVNTPGQDEEPPNGAEGGSRKKDKRGRGTAKAENARSRQTLMERPLVTLLASSADGTYLIAVSGHDKTVWVFRHDGQGNLEQISRRAMPKRPVSVAVSPDAQIICADKFGDVYAMPLLYSASTAVPPQTSSASSSPAPSSAPKAPKKVAASALTVHSQRNLRALQQQQRLESENAHLAAGGGEKGRADAPEFEHMLLLGHVSMLTSLAFGEREGRRYIITSDRDEHIRVSRYIPQAHVIEGFCLGHRDFISSIEIPCTRSDVLVSGGGDDEVFVWDWHAGELLSRTSLLKLAREIVPETSKVALSHLSSLVYPSASGDLVHILAICEDIKAIFAWRLHDDNSLKYPAVIQLPGNPLHLTIASKAGHPPRIAVAIDPGEENSAPSIGVYSLTMSDDRLAVDTTASVAEDTAESESLDVSPEAIRHLLYGIENLRKTTDGTKEDDGDGDGVGDRDLEDAPV